MKKRARQQRKSSILIDLYLQDEAPNIGCGRRPIYVHLGRKWAYLTTKVKKGLTPRRARMLRTTFDRLMAAPGNRGAVA